MLRNGFRFNLETETWEAQRFPPHIMINGVADADALFSFRGRPTVFGHPVCDGAGDCEYKEILQFNELSSSWDTLGMMLDNRQLHEVIEVPAEICEGIFPPEQSTVPPPPTTEPAPAEIETVAMIIGGFWNYDNEGITGNALSEVELFGCPGNEDSSVILQDYPEAVYFSAGTLYENRVISCGGFTCRGGLAQICAVMDACFEWTPQDQWQPFADNLDNQKWAHFMGMSPDIDSSSTDEVPIVLGGGASTEIWDPTANEWKEYYPLETSSQWISTHCLFQHENYIYHLFREIERINTSDWTLDSLGTLPDFLQDPMAGRCAYQEFEGRPGNKRVLVLICIKVISFITT